MIVFAGGRISSRREGVPPSPQRPERVRRVPQPLVGTVPLTPVIDANPGTFYSAMSNIDLEIGDGNAGAVAFAFMSRNTAFFRIWTSASALGSLHFRTSATERTFISSAAATVL